LTEFYLGIVVGMICAACIAGLYAMVAKIRHNKHEPIDWQERAYAPPVFIGTTHKSINRIREINL
jgi:hypothetical protein